MKKKFISIGNLISFCRRHPRLSVDLDSPFGDLCAQFANFQYGAAVRLHESTVTEVKLGGVVVAVIDPLWVRWQQSTDNRRRVAAVRTAGQCIPLLEEAEFLPERGTRRITQ